MKKDYLGPYGNRLQEYEHLDSLIQFISEGTQTNNDYILHCRLSLWMNGK